MDWRKIMAMSQLQFWLREALFPMERNPSFCEEILPVNPNTE